MNWICGKCNHETISDIRPESPEWSDGHICRFRRKFANESEWQERKELLKDKLKGRNETIN